MHELSIAQALVELVSEALERAGGGRVVAVHLRVGALAGIVQESLEFCFEVAARGTPLEDARLDIEELPVIIHCPTCQTPAELPGVQWFCCPRCETLSGQILQGKELEVASIEILEPDHLALAPSKAKP